MNSKKGQRPDWSAGSRDGAQAKEKARSLNQVRE